MRTLRFGRTNAQVSAVSLGTWGHGGPNKSGEASVGWSGHDDKLALEALVAAYRGGITHWDTADVYGDGNAERLIGSVWGEVKRRDLFLATKVGWDPGAFGRFYHPKLIRARMDRSLSNLRTDVIDLHYFHHCDFGPRDEYLDEAIDTFHKLREAGKIRFIGLSDWDSDKVVRLADRVRPDVVQPYRNVVDDRYQSSGLQEWVEKNDAGVAFFSPLKHGLLLGKYDEPVTFPDGDFRSRIPEFTDPEALARMKRNRRELERKFSDRREPVLYALVGALLSGAPVGCVLLGQRNPRQVAAALEAGDPLTAEEAAWVKGLYATK